MDQFAYSLQGDRLPSLPDDVPGTGLPPAPAAALGQQFGMNGGNRPASGIPKFFVKASRKADGTYDNVEMVEIITPGDPKATPILKVTDGVRAKYSDYYTHWKRTQQMAPVGTPLEMWPMMQPAMVTQLKAGNIFTVEQLAEISDGNLHHVPFGKTVREQARAWLGAKEKSDAIEQATAQTHAMQDGMRMMEQRFAQQDAEKDAKIGNLQASLDAVLAKLAAPVPPVVAAPAREAPVPLVGRPASWDAPEPPKRGPGRPKAAEAA